jgi:hypothetical protein
VALTILLTCHYLAPHMPLSRTSHVTPVAPSRSHVTLILRFEAHRSSLVRTQALPKAPNAYSSYVASNDALALSMSRFTRSYTYRHISAASNNTGPRCKVLFCLSRDAGSKASP